MAIIKKFMMPRLPKLNKASYGLIFIIFIIALSALVRLHMFNYESLLYAEDGTRDYLVASHIVQYGEFPMAGPVAGGLLHTSPLYFYALASILLIKNDLLFLGLVNIFFQILAIGILYIFAKRIFGLQIAVGAAILFGLSQFAITHSLKIWQPYIAEPFLYLSYLLLLISYQRKKFASLLMAIFVFIFSGALWGVMFFAAPLFAILVFVILRNQKARLRHYALVSATALGSFFAFFAPLVFSPNYDRQLVFSFSKILLVPHGYFSRLLTNMSILVDSFFYNTNTNLLSLNNVLLIIFIGSLIYVLYSNKNASRMIYIALIAASIVQFLLVLSFLPYDNSSLRFFIPAFGSMVILVASSAQYIFSSSLVSKLAKIILIALLVYVSSPRLGHSWTQGPGNNFSINVGAKNLAAEKIKEELIEITQEIGASHIVPFDIIAYNSGNRHVLGQSGFWVALEKSLGKKFTTIEDANFLNYRPLSKGNYYKFLICYNKGASFKHGGILMRGIEPAYDISCVNSFLDQFPNHRIIKDIYSAQNLKVYRAEAS